MTNEPLSVRNKYIFTVNNPDSIVSVSHSEVLCIKGEEAAQVIRSALLVTSLLQMKRVGIFDHSFQTPSFIKKRIPERIVCRSYEITIAGDFYAFEVRDSFKNIAFDTTFGEVTGIHSSFLSYLREHGSYACDSAVCALQEINPELIIKNTVSLDDAGDELLYVLVEEYISKEEAKEAIDDHLLWKVREERRRGVKRVVIDRSLERLGEEVKDEDLLRGKKSVGVVLRTIPSRTESFNETLEAARREAVAESEKGSRVVLYVFKQDSETKGHEYVRHAHLSVSHFCTTCTRSFSFKETRHAQGEAILEECTDKKNTSLKGYSFPELHVGTLSLSHLSQSVGEMVTLGSHHFPDEIQKNIEKYLAPEFDSVPLSRPWGELTEYQRLICYLSRLPEDDLVGYVFIIDALIISGTSFDYFYTSLEGLRKKGAVIVLLSPDEGMMAEAPRRKGYRFFGFAEGGMREVRVKKTSIHQKKTFPCDTDEPQKSSSIYTGSGNGGIILVGKDTLNNSSVHSLPNVHVSLAGSRILLQGDHPNSFLALGIKGPLVSCDAQMIVDVLGLFSEVVSLFSKTLKARVEGIDDSDFHPGGSLSCSSCRGAGYFLEESILGYSIADICLHCEGTRISGQASRYECMGVTMPGLLQIKIADVPKILEGELLFNRTLSILNHFELGSLTLGSYFFSLLKEERIKFSLSLLAILSESSPMVFHAENLFSEIPTFQKQHYFDLLSPWFSKGKSSLRI